MAFDIQVLARRAFFGLTLACTVSLVAAPAWSDGDRGEPRGKPGPRWSNSHHHDLGTVVGRDCIQPDPDLDPRHKPGLDARGRPVIPADQGRAFRPRPPVDVDFDIILKEKTIAGRPIDLRAGRFTFDPATGRLALNGVPLTEDCAPAVK